MVTCQMLQNYIIASNIFNILHTCKKVKCYLFRGNVAFSSIQITTIYFVSALQHPREICVEERKLFKMILNMNGLLNRFLI